MSKPSELASERVTTLMTAREKAALEGKAHRAGVSVGEFVRQSVDAFDPDDAALLTQLGALVVEVRRSKDAAAKALDEALAEIAETKAQLRGRKAA